MGASRRLAATLAIAASFSVAGGAPMTADAASAAPQDVVVLGTATPGGGFPTYGAALATMRSEIDSSLSVTPRNTKGSTENVPLLEAGQLDIALVQGEVAYEALSGIGRRPAALTIIAAMYSTPGMFVVRADSPYRTIGDLRGKAVAFGARGSGLVILARDVLDGIGLDQEGDFTAVYLDRAGDGPAMVMDGRVAALWGGGLGLPGFSPLAEGPPRAPLLAPSAAGAAPVRPTASVLQTLTIAARSSPGQPNAVTPGRSGS